MSGPKHEALPEPMSTSAPKPKTREELLKALADRAEAERKRRNAHELLCLELEDKFCTHFGARGQKWQMVNEADAVGAGPICLKPAEITVWKLWQSKASGYEEQFAFVQPSVIFPDGAVFNELVYRFPELLGHCVIALNALAGQNREELKGKL